MHEETGNFILIVASLQPSERQQSRERVQSNQVEIGQLQAASPAFSSLASFSALQGRARELLHFVAL